MIDFTYKYNNKSLKSDYLDYYLKIVIHGRIHNHHTFIFNNESIKKCKHIQGYTILPLETGNGHIILFINKDKDLNINYNSYIYHNVKMEIIYIKNGIFDKLIEEDLDLRLYLQTLLKNDYQKFTSDVYVLKNNLLTNLGDNFKLNLHDILFYSSQLYLLSSLK